MIPISVFMQINGCAGKGYTQRLYCLACTKLPHIKASITTGIPTCIYPNERKFKTHGPYTEKTEDTDCTKIPWADRSSRSVILCFHIDFFLCLLIFILIPKETGVFLECIWQNIRTKKTSPRQ